MTMVSGQKKSSPKATKSHNLTHTSISDEYSLRSSSSTRNHSSDKRQSNDGSNTNSNNDNKKSFGGLFRTRSTKSRRQGRENNKMDASVLSHAPSQSRMDASVLSRAPVQSRMDASLRSRTPAQSRMDASLFSRTPAQSPRTKDEPKRDTTNNKDKENKGNKLDIPRSQSAGAREKLNATRHRRVGSDWSFEPPRRAISMKLPRSASRARQAQISSDISFSPSMEWEDRVEDTASQPGLLQLAGQPTAFWCNPCFDQPMDMNGDTEEFINSIASMTQHTLEQELSLAQTDDEGTRQSIPRLIRLLARKNNNDSKNNNGSTNDNHDNNSKNTSIFNCGPEEVSMLQDSVASSDDDEAASVVDSLAMEDKGGCQSADLVSSGMDPCQTFGDIGEGLGSFTDMLFLGDRSTPQVHHW